MTEQEWRDALAKRFANVTIDTLESEIRDVMSADHDYGTICVAIGHIAAAAARAADRMPSGGITGFQAGAVFWEFTRAWGVFGDGPKRVVTYADMLYPQYADKMAPTLASHADKQVARWLDDINAMLDSADSLEQFREQLLTRYKALPADELVTVMATALSAINLRGRAEVLGGQ